MKKLYIEYDPKIGIYAKTVSDNGTVKKYIDNSESKNFTKLMNVIKKHLKKGYSVVGNNIIVSDINICISKNIIFDIYNDDIEFGIYKGRSKKANRFKSVAGVTFLSALLALELFVNKNNLLTRYQEDPSFDYALEEVVEEVVSTPAPAKQEKVYTIFKGVEGTEEMYQDFDRCKEEYGDLIQKYASSYGIDPSIITAIGASNINERNLNSVNYYGNIGIMGLKYYQLHQREVRVFNYNTKQFDRFTIIAEPISDPQEGVIYENMQDPESNIKIMCALIQIAYRDYDNNLMMALESILKKYKDFRREISDYSKIHGISTSLVYGNKVDYSWLTDIYNHDLSRSYALKILSYIRPGTEIIMVDYSLDEVMDAEGKTRNLIMPKFDKYKIDSYTKEKTLR